MEEMVGVVVQRFGSSLLYQLWYREKEKASTIIRLSALCLSALSL
jgi:hypothetical protein